jgi:signal transduction histidine kinase
MSPAPGGVTDVKEDPAFFARLLSTRVPELMERYRARLVEIGSPLARDAVNWEQCAAQARRILDDCVRAAAAEGTDADRVTEAPGAGARTHRQNTHPIHAIRAGTILSDVALGVIADCGALAGMPQPALFDAVRALQRGIAQRLEFGSISYDTLLLQWVRDGHEQNRRQLARGIHDHIGNSISLALRQIELCELEYERAGAGPGVLHVRLAKEAIRDSIICSRELVGELRRSDVSGSLDIALRGFAESLGPMQPQLKLWVHGDDGSMPGILAEELFVMVRECLRNAYTHAGAANVVVRIDISPCEVHAEIVDDGRGFDVSATAGHGYGLLVLRERAELVGGTVCVESTPGEGTRVAIRIPMTGVDGHR